MTFDEIIDAIKVEPYYLDREYGQAIYCGDCRDILPTLDKVDLVLTDFPYGNDTDYGTYEDTQDNLRGLIRTTMPLILEAGKVALVACGIGNMWEYPKPNWVLSWSWENTASGSSVWGFNCWQPILAYGKDPYLVNGLGRRQDSKLFRSIDHKKTNHPCPKPDRVWDWLITRGSISTGDTILDPFLGSGTTAYCAKKLNRKCIGIEIEEKYCEIAAKRLSQSVMRL